MAEGTGKVYIASGNCSAYYGGVTGDVTPYNMFVINDDDIYNEYLSKVGTILNFNMDSFENAIKRFREDKISNAMIALPYILPVGTDSSHQSAVDFALNSVNDMFEGIVPWTTVSTKGVRGDNYRFSNDRGFCNLGASGTLHNVSPTFPFVDGSVRYWASHATLVNDQLTGRYFELSLIIVPTTLFLAPSLQDTQIIHVTLTMQLRTGTTYACYLSASTENSNNGSNGLIPDYSPLSTMLEEYIPISPGNPDNPYKPGGETKPDEEDKGEWGGGDGPFEPDTSRLYTTFAGLFRVYAMQLNQLLMFGQRLWNGTVIDELAKRFDNPMDVVMGLIEIPFDVQSGDSEDIKFNWLPTWNAFEIPVKGHPVTLNYQKVTFGEISIPRYSGTFYDFQPYTQAQVFIPYVGFVPIKFSEIVGSTVRLDYCIDVITGAGVATLTSGKRGMIGIYNCNIGRNLPLTSRNFSDLYIAVAKAAMIAIGTAAVAGVAGAGGAAAGATASGGVGASQALVATDTAFPATYSTELTPVESGGALAAPMKQPIDFSPVYGKNPMPSFEGRFAQSALNGAMNSNFPIQRSGSFDPITGRCGPQNAAVYISIPHQNLPENYSEMFGFPSNIGGVCSDFAGYTQFRKVFLQVEANATQAEIDEIESMMIGGIVI